MNSLFVSNNLHRTEQTVRGRGTATFHSFQLYSYVYVLPAICHKRNCCRFAVTSLAVQLGIDDLAYISILKSDRGNEDEETSTSKMRQCTNLQKTLSHGRQNFKYVVQQE